MFHLRKRILRLLRAASHPTTAAPSTSLRISTLLLLSTSASPSPFSIDEYLVTICGLTPAQALKASKKLSHVKSASKPDAVLALLSGVGLSRSEIAVVVAADPMFLHSRAGNVGPRLAALRDRFGLSVPEIVRFLLVGSFALRSCGIAPKLEFWIPFYGSFDRLLRLMKANSYLLRSNLEKAVKPNIALLEACGLTVCDIAKLPSRLLVCNPERMKEFVLRADELGVPRSSFLYKYAVHTVGFVSGSKVSVRLEFLKSTLGCSLEKLSAMVSRNPKVLAKSEENIGCKIQFLISTLGCSAEKVSDAVCKNPSILGMSQEALGGKIKFLKSTLHCSMEKLSIAVWKHPSILNLSEENIGRKIQFLNSTLGCSVEKVSDAVCKKPQILGMSDERLGRKIHFFVTELGVEQDYIVERPVVLTFSLEKRLVPRHYVGKILKSKGLLKKDARFYPIVSCSEKDFRKKYIDCMKDAVPGLRDAYAAICAGEMPPVVHL